MLNNLFQHLKQFTDCLNYFLMLWYSSENRLADLSVNAPLLTAVVLYALLFFVMVFLLLDDYMSQCPSFGSIRPDIK